VARRLRRRNRRWLGLYSLFGSGWPRQAYLRPSLREPGIFGSVLLPCVWDRGLPRPPPPNDMISIAGVPDSAIGRDESAASVKPRSTDQE